MPARIASDQPSRNNKSMAGIKCKSASGLSEPLKNSAMTRANVSATILAPVNVAALDTKRGASIASSRIESGADCLLAQPPTSDVSVTFPEHLRLLDGKGLRTSVLLNVFPFRDKEDIDACRTRFGWKIPEVADRLAEEGGEARLIRESKMVVEKMRENRLPGVYVSTRGKPELARFILD